jgi:hypothetical protein
LLAPFAAELPRADADDRDGEARPAECAISHGGMIGAEFADCDWMFQSDGARGAHNKAIKVTSTIPFGSSVALRRRMSGGVGC